MVLNAENNTATYSSKELAEVQKDIAEVFLIADKTENNELKLLARSIANGLSVKLNRGKS